MSVDLKVVSGNRHSIQWDEDLIRRYDTAGPRYTSYPTANHFHEEFGEAEYRAACEQSNTQRRPLSLYFHLPFCNTVCYYCACNKIITGDRSRSRDYLDVMKEEIRLQSALFAETRPVTQLHWGGGTPTFFTPAELTELMHHIARHFRLLGDDRGEYSIEIDPRTVDTGMVGLLRKLGFNRLSLGVQDFDPTVQRAVNRIQSSEQVRNVTDVARGLGFKSISYDLIYGLPHQTVDTFRATLDKVVDLLPDRISVYSYAHLPARFKTQRQIDEAALPPPQEKLRILEETIRHLLDAGYVYIGMDHFARPDDELALALSRGDLQRNFQGYSTQRGADLVGIGLSSISQIGDSFAQNAKAVTEYSAAINSGRLSVDRGLTLSADDKVRRDVIMDIACRGRVLFSDVEGAHGIRFERYFAAELERLQSMQEDGLVEISPQKITVLPRGRLLLRSICMVFDIYLRKGGKIPTFSRVI
ncbi:MAG: oxygen-independent coproporphyrinogen III oxidase [Gammaproteobacteria bacterium]